MTNYFTEIVQQAVYLTLLISGIPLLMAVTSSLIISVLQAALSIQEQTTGYLVRLLSLVLSLYLCSHWFSRQIIDFIILCLKAMSKNFIETA